MLTKIIYLLSIILFQNKLLVTGKCIIPIISSIQSTTYNNSSEQLKLNQLIEKYRQAHKEKSLEAVLSLYYSWEKVDKRIKKSVETNHKRYLSYKIVEINVAKVPPKKYNEFLLEGIKYKTSLEVTKVLKIKFENTGNITKEVTIPLGQKDGIYYFVTARPVDKKPRTK